MNPRRITDYFPRQRPISPPPRCYFLEIPSHVRQTIYRYVGPIPTNEWMELNYGEDWQLGNDDTWLGWHPHGEWYDDEFEDDEEKVVQDVHNLVIDDFASRQRNTILPSPYQLLRVCRMIYQEIIKVLYGSNFWNVTREAPKGLNCSRI